MALSTSYVARETVSNLWRNRLMTIAAVLTVAVSLALVGASLLLRQGVAHATARWQHGVNVLVWLQPGADTTGITPQQQTIEHELYQLPYLRACTFRSQEFDFAEAKHLLAPDVSQALTVDSTPASLRCALDDPLKAQAVAAQFTGMPGVKAVNYPSQSIHNMEQVTKILQVVFLALAVILLLSASVLILNTIRLAIFARRREVSVMKLVGATNWFIRVPFMFEGLVQGVLGALVASLSVVALHMVLDHFASGSAGGIFYQMRTPGSEVLATDLVVMLIGVSVGSIGSAFAIRRFLEA